MNSKKRIPKPFRKPISPKKFNHRIVRRIHVQSELDFLNSKLTQDGQGNYVIDTEKLGKDDLKRLTRLSKAIKKNKGLLVGWKAAILLVILAGTLGFNYLLKNRLIKTGVESYLQGIFRAQVELESPDLSLLAGTLSFEHLSIADADQPMQNLIEIGRSTLSIDVGRLLSKKLIINEASSREIQFETSRSTSGELPASERRDTEEGQSNTAKEENLSGTTDGAIAQAGALGLEIGRDSAENIIRSYQDSLQSPDLIEEVNARYRESRQKWEERIETVQRQVDSVETRTDQVLTTDVSSIDSIGKAEDYLTKLKNLKSIAESAGETAEAAYSAYQEDTRSLRESRSSIEEALKKDIDFLESAVGSFATDTLQVVAATARPILRTKFKTLIEYSERIGRTFSQIKSTSSQKQSKFADRGRRGTTVRFPMKNFPAFLLKNFELSSGTTATGDVQALKIHDLTGDQDTLGRPTSVELSSDTVGGGMNTQLIIDAREQSDSLLTGDITLNRVPLSLSEGLSTLSINSFAADSHNRIEINVQPDLSGQGKAFIELSKLEFTFSEDAHVIGEALRNILSGIETTTFEAAFNFSDGQLNSLQVTSELDQVLSQRIANYAQEQARVAAAKMETAMYDYLEEELAINSMLSEELSQEGRRIVEGIKTAENLEQLIETEQEQIKNRQAKIKQRLRDEVDTQADTLKDEAGEAVKELGENLNFPSF
ncbi:MAG: TIGR03545 family protein [Spirochaetaceae bacterium]|nr:TIGR03545 family protein [Spirochaetaceae bacterium]MCF7947354.1 TIGR03545 family protein [Spirochaetia bacterium]MCF7952181.1 TIGR03545 family protein [Spirochaetaceae bacterium]